MDALQFFGEGHPFGISGEFPARVFHRPGLDRHNDAGAEGIVPQHGFEWDLPGLLKKIIVADRDGPRRWRAGAFSWGGGHRSGRLTKQLSQATHQNQPTTA